MDNNYSNNNQFINFANNNMNQQGVQNNYGYNNTN